MILFITFLVGAIACVVISVAVHFCGDFLSAGQGYSRALAAFISICLSTVFSLVWMVRMVSATLPTALLYALGVTFIYWATAATILWAIVLLTGLSWLTLESIF